ncbi:MAG: transporter, partial [Gammaproteobacteria bacterium]
MITTRIAPIAAFVLGVAIAPAVHAELTAEELAKIAQNPVGNMVSVPFQYNANLNYGPEKGTLGVLNIQPVIPIEVNKDWNVITRTI